MALKTSILTAGTNNHQTTSEEANRFTTNFVTPGVVGSFSNTSGVAPMTGSFAVNAQGTPNKTVTIGIGDIVIATTPTSQALQNLTTRNDSTITYTVIDNAGGSTLYDWVYIANNATNANNPAVDASNVSSVTVNRSTSSTTDTVGTPANSQCIAIITAIAGFTSIPNSAIADKRAAAGAAVPAGSIGPTSLAANAISQGYSQITSNFTTTSTTVVQVTGLSVTVTVPSGGRRYKLTAWAPNITNNTTNTGMPLTIWDGTVGTGTQLAGPIAGYPSTGGTNVQQPGVTAMAVVTPSAGSKTYNVGFYTSGGTATLICGATNPAFLLVEAI